MIFHLIHGGGEGGAEKVAARLTSGGGRNARLLSLGPVHPDLKSFAPHIRSLGIPDDDHLPPGRRFPALLKRIEHIRRLKATALVAHDDASHEAAVLAAASGGLPVVRMIHTALDWTPEDHRRAFHIYHAATRFFFCVEEKTCIEAKRLQLPAARMPQPIDLRRLPAVRPKLEGKISQLLFVGRLEWAKGADVLIQAMEKLPRNVRLDVVGDGPERPNLQNLSDRLGLTNRIRFRGRQADVGRWYRKSGLVVLPSRSEGVSLVMLEAMASGVPVIATAVGGNLEMMKKFKLSRLLVPPENPAALARTIHSFLESLEEYRTNLERVFAQVRRTHDAGQVRRRVERKIAEYLNR